MDRNYNAKIAEELTLHVEQVADTVKLLDDGSTVPFISRYRKEVTGNLDEVVVTNIRDRVGQLRELDKRRATVLHSIHEQGKLTDELKEKIIAAQTLVVLEDIYLPLPTQNKWMPHFHSPTPFEFLQASRYCGQRVLFRVLPYRCQQQ